MLRLMMRRLHRQEEGFTLIELLVVIAIVALLAAFAAPKLYNAMNGARDVNAKADMQTVTNALDRYNFDLNGYPTTAGVKAGLSNGYVKNNFEWKNGYGYPYVYASDGSTWYVLIDTANQGAGSYTLTCGSTTSGSTTTPNTITFTQAKGSGPLAPTVTGTPTLSACAWTASPSGADTTKLQFITNN